MERLNNIEVAALIATLRAQILDVTNNVNTELATEQLCTSVDNAFFHSGEVHRLIERSLHAPEIAPQEEPPITFAIAPENRGHATFHFDRSGSGRAAFELAGPAFADAVWVDLEIVPLNEPPVTFP